MALANSAERDLTVKPAASKPSEGVFTVTNKHTLRGPVPTSKLLSYSNSTKGTGRRKNTVKNQLKKIPVTDFLGNLGVKLNILVLLSYHLDYRPRDILLRRPFVFWSNIGDLWVFQ